MKLTNMIIALMLSAAVSSCSFLDFDETQGLKSKEDMYKYYNSVEQMLNNVYSYMPNNLADATMRDCGCDDAEHGNAASRYQYFIKRLRSLLFRAEMPTTGTPNTAESLCVFTSM